MKMLSIGGSLRKGEGMRRDNNSTASGMSIRKTECTTETMVIYTFLTPKPKKYIRVRSDKVVICGTLSRSDYRNNLHSLPYHVLLFSFDLLVFFAVN